MFLSHGVQHVAFWWWFLFSCFIWDTPLLLAIVYLFLGFLIFFRLGISWLIPKVQLSWLTLEFRHVCLMLEIDNVQGTHLWELHAGSCLGPTTAIFCLSGFFLLANNLFYLIFLILKLLFFTSMPSCFLSK